MEQNIEKSKHTLSIRDVTCVTGVTSVISLGEKEVRLAVGNKSLLLQGRAFSAEKLSLEEGVLVLSGEIESLRYTAKADAKSFWKKLFK